MVRGRTAPFPARTRGDYGSHHTAALQEVQQQMTENTLGREAEPRTAVAATRMGRSRGDRAQLAATLRWLRELRPAPRPAVTRRPGGSTS